MNRRADRANDLARRLFALHALYYGTSGQNYTNSVMVANTNSATISGLADGTTYYFAAAAVDNAGDVSTTSNQAVYETPSAAATLTTLPASTGGFSFNVSGVSGYQYVVQSSTDLINWVSIATNKAPFIFTDTRTPHMSHCFYRTFYLQPNS